MDEVVRTRVGETFEITLEGNATTGFRWELVSPAENAHLILLLSSSYEANVSRAGAPGVFRFRFQGIEPGEIQLVFQHRRPWERGQPREERVFLVRSSPAE